MPTRSSGAFPSPRAAKARSISPSRAADVKRLAAAILALALTPTLAPTLTGAKADVISPAPADVSVTFYYGGKPGSTLADLSVWSFDYFGFVSETRVVDLPAGESTVRFRGVASS